MRASDADRDRVIDQLRAAVADGRLDPAEFNERADAALAARTIEALALLTSDLGTAAHRDTALAQLPTDPPVEKLTIRERHGLVQRDGRWTLPHRLAIHTAWTKVRLDLTSAVRSGPELIIEMRIRGGSVELVLSPDMTVDANGLAARFAGVDIRRDADDDTPQSLHICLVGRIKHGRITARWQAPHQ
ncbi:MAG TPA: DUF1707 domain-containing protein [Actinocrinis sp.]